MTGAATSPYAVAMAKEITAERDPVGAIGCGLPGLVSKSLGNYQQAPPMRALLKRRKPPVLPRWVPPRSPYASLEALAGLVPLLALAGFVVAFSLAAIREWIVNHGIVTAGIAVLSLVNGLLKTFGPGAPLVAFEGFGLILLLISALVMVRSHTGFPWLTSFSTPAAKPNPE